MNGTVRAGRGAAAMFWLVACGGAGSSVAPVASATSPTSTHEPRSQPPAVADLGAVETAIAANDYGEAKRQAAAVLARSPKNAKALYYAGVAAEGLSDVAGAEAYYRQALRVAPDLREVMVNLAALLLDQKRAPEAVALLKPIAAKTPDDLLVQRNFATALGAAGDHASAALAYERVLRGLPKETQAGARLGLAEERLALGERESALRTLREGVDGAGVNREQLGALGRAMARCGGFPDAIAVMDRAIRLQASADLLTYRGLFRRSASNPNGARGDFEAALQQDPAFAPAAFYLGELAEEQKKFDEARKAYETAAKNGGQTAIGKRATEKLRTLPGRR